jgi:hypothetical protein
MLSLSAFATPRPLPVWIAVSLVAAIASPPNKTAAALPAVYFTVQKKKTGKAEEAAEPDYNAAPLLPP